MKTGHLYRLKNCLIVMLFASIGISQESTSSPKDSILVGFENASIQISKSYTEDVEKRFVIQLDSLTIGNEYEIIVELDRILTTTSDPEYNYELSRSKVKAENKSEKAYILFTLFEDEIFDREKEIVFRLNCKNTADSVETINLSSARTFKVIIGNQQPLANLNYLAHLGTNFDLVDGVKPKELFFAANFFIPNKNTEYTSNAKRRKFWKAITPPIGYYFSLYGNRSFSSTDTARVLSRISDFIILANSDSVGIILEDADQSTSSFSDNLGAQISFPINTGKWSNPANKTKFHLLPSAEFIWRRSTTTSRFSNMKIRDTLYLAEFDLIQPILNSSEISNSNQFEFNYGLGFFIDHSSEDISLRFNWSVGLSEVFKSGGLNSAAYKLFTDFYFSGKLWIVEPNSGLTLQAEVFNRSLNPQPYYVVSLSKAFNLSSLGGILKPLTSR